ncbi:GNAT family N-acetyltransferase [Streptomyces sp. NPDC001508]|uniref:GNAT family N-acetyltransferase n=1 Tax=Streptomyces sp. NPDC001508 TaxID=3154656 RepID=UPI003330C0C2
MVHGDPQGAVDLLLRLLDVWPTALGDGPDEVTLPRDAHLLLPAPLRPDTVRQWAYRWLTVAPPLMADEDQVLELRFTDPRLTGFLTEHHPTYDIAPGTPSIVRWAGIEDEDGNLIACGSHQRTEFTGFPQLGSIATATARRGSGLGAAVTAWLSRRAIDEAGVCTLVHPSGNISAARLFTRLGYETDDSYTTFRLHR